MNSNKMLAFTAVLVLLISSCVFSSVNGEAAEANALERHYTIRGEYDNNSEPVSSSAGSFYFGTILNPYSSVNVDVVKIPDTQKNEVYVLEGAPCKVYTMEKVVRELHDDLIAHGFVYDDGWYIGKAYYVYHYPALTFGLDNKFCIHTVKQEGYAGYNIGDPVSGDGFCSEKEPILYLDSENLRWLGYFYTHDIYIAKGAHFRLKCSDGNFKASIDGPSLGISNSGGYLVCDSLQAGDTKICHNAMGTGSTEFTISLHVVPYTELPTVFFDANGGKCSVDHYTVSVGSRILLPSAEGSDKFTGWFTEPEGGMRVGDAGDTYFVEKKTTLYAHYGEEKITITSKIVDPKCVLGSTFSYDVTTTPSKIQILLEGPSWLTVSDHKIYGTPVAIEPGVYHFVIKATNGVTYDIQEFDLTVLEPEVKNAPTGKIIIHPIYEVII